MRNCLPTHTKNILFPKNFPLADSNRSDAHKCHMGPKDIPIFLLDFDRIVFLTLCGSWNRKYKYDDNSDIRLKRV